MKEETLVSLYRPSTRRYSVEKAIIEGSDGDSQCFLVLDDGIPAVEINRHLLVKQKLQSRPSSTPAYNLCMFLNAMVEMKVDIFSVSLGMIYNYLNFAFVEDGRSYTSIMSYITDIADLYESLALRFPLHESLYRPADDNFSGPRVRRSKKDMPLTNVGLLRKEFRRKKSDTSLIGYTKWYGVAEMEAIAAQLPITYRCIFYDTIFTGHRIDSALSIKMDGVNLKNRQVRPTRTKTGKMHTSALPVFLADLMQTYLVEERRKIVSSTGSTSDYFFLGRDGAPVKYGAFYKALKRAGEKAMSKDPGLHIEDLHTHAGRSTFAATLRSYQLEKRRLGEKTFSDDDFCTLMDWKSMTSLENYDIATRAQEVSPLLKDFFSQYMDFADANLSRPAVTSPKEG